MSDPFAPLLKALRALKAQGEAGFEGFMRDLLQHISGRTLRLMKSGPQGGKDVVGDADAACPGIAIEAKRFSQDTNLSLDMQKSKLRDALDSTPDLDIWGIVASRDLKDPDWTQLKTIAQDKGVTLLCLDWRSAPGALPVLAALCAAGRHIAEKRLPGTIKTILDEIEQHPEFDRIVEDIRRQLTAPEVGFDLARDAARQWLENAVASSANARRHLQSHADLGSPEARYVSRPAIEASLTQWWVAGPKVPAVLLGDEGRGKTWVALSWCRQLPDAGAPLVLAVSAKDIRFTDAEEILSNLLSRCMPNVPRAQVAVRIKRWLMAEGGSPWILLMIDGLNEAWNTQWGDIVRSFDVEPWKGRVALLLTSRTAFWRDDLLRLRGATETPPVEIDVPVFSDAELTQFLRRYSLTKNQLPRGLLELVRIPRFARLAISLKDQLGETEDITPARLVLEDWRERLAQRGANLRLNDEELLGFVADLGKEVLADRDFEISRTEIHDRLSEDSGNDLEHYRSAISDLVEGHWLKPGDRPHNYTLSEHLLPYAIGLDLARSVETLTDPSEIEDRIAKYEEQLRGADIGVRILRAATSLSFGRRKATRAAREGLLKTWLRSQNFDGADFDELWPLISLDPVLFLDFAAAHWCKNPVGYREGEILAKALANAAKWPKVHDLLAVRLAHWSGAYGSDPVHWRFGPNVPQDDARKLRTEGSLAEWRSVQSRYHRPITDHLRVDADDHLPEAALAIMSFLPRAPFVEALITCAMTHAISHDDNGLELLHWLVRLNPHDHAALETITLEEAALLKGLSVPVASTAADILLHALATRRAMDARSQEGRLDIEARRFANWPELDTDDAVVWHDPDGTLSPIVWAERLAPFASLPHAKLSKADQKKLGAILEDVGSDANVDDFTAVLRRATPALARWTPSLLGQAIRRTYFSLPQRTGPDAGRLVHQLADVSLVLSDRERDHLLERGFDELGKLAPDDTAQSKESRRSCQSMIVAGVIGKPAEEQIAALKNLAPNFHFGIDLARLLTPPTTEDLRSILDLLAKEHDEHAISGWLGYLNCLKMPPMPSNADVLLSLVTHTNENIRGAAIQLIVQADDVSLGAAFVDSGWSHIKGQSSQEAIYGSYLIAKYGTHLEFDVARKRITPQGLAILVEKRGMRDDEIHVLFAYTAELLDEKVSEKRIERYGYGRAFDAKDAWRKVVLLDDGAIIEKLRHVATAGKLVGFFDIFPLVDVMAAIMELRPEDGAEIWTLVKKGHQRASINIGDFNYLPFRGPDHEKIVELRGEILGLAKNDEDIAQIAYSALSGGCENWLIGVIREDIAAASAGVIAMGLTLAGLLDATENATKLWRDEIEVLPLAGWLTGVRGEAWRRYQSNVHARYWFGQFLASRNSDEAFAYMLLFQETLDLRHNLWAQPMIDQQREDMPSACLRHIDATGDTRASARKKIDDDMKKLLFSTRTVSGLAPWF